MNVYVVTTPDIAQTAVFTTERKAQRYLYHLGCYMACGTDCFSLWKRDYNMSAGEPFKAYIRCVELVGAEHNYKYECKQLRATVRYLHDVIKGLKLRIAVLRNLNAAYKSSYKDTGTQFVFTNNGIYDKVTGLCIKSY